MEKGGAAIFEEEIVFTLVLLEFIWDYFKRILQKHEGKILEIIVISISRNGLLKSCARLIIERSEIRNKQHDFSTFYGKKVDFSPISCKKHHSKLEMDTFKVLLLFSYIASLDNKPRTCL